MTERSAEDRRVDRAVWVLIGGAVCFWTIPDLVLWWYEMVSSAQPSQGIVGMRGVVRLAGAGLLITGIVLAVRIGRQRGGL